jgi:S1-C subfamily serine protease
VLRRLLLATALLSAGVMGGLVLSGRMSVTSPSVAAPEPQQSAVPARPAAAALPNLSDIAERAIKASVNISSTRYVQVDPFFQLWWGGDAVVPQTSLGSGVLVSSDGLVLTNSHVVGNARNSDIRVTLADDPRELAATVIGVDQLTDLAVVKVETTGGAPLPWGDSSTLRVAEWVLAVGNPFTFSQTVTLGIVSNVNRHDPQLATYNDFIQTDAAINPGNSGGALVNSRGELVGINTMIYSQTGGYQGIGFAIPANLARGIMDELVRNGEVVRGSIGNLTLRTITASEARGNRLGDVGGVFVYNMYRSDPAYRAGIEPGDIIVRYNGVDVTEESQLQRLIAASKIGSTARVEVIRGGQRRAFEVPVVRRSAVPGRRM